jgi:hypothetical protein
MLRASMNVVSATILVESVSLMSNRMPAKLDRDYFLEVTSDDGTA